MDQYGIPNLTLGTELYSCIGDHMSVSIQKPENPHWECQLPEWPHCIHLQYVLQHHTGANNAGTETPVDHHDLVLCFREG